jgi:hypothetical protein
MEFFNNHYKNGYFKQIEDLPEVIRTSLVDAAGFHIEAAFHEGENPLPFEKFSQLIIQDVGTETIKPYLISLYNEVKLFFQRDGNEINDLKFCSDLDMQLYFNVDFLMGLLDKSEGGKL